MSWPEDHQPGCFGCGPANPCSLGIRLELVGDTVVGEMHFDRYQEGAPGLVHGGALAAVFDEALGSVPDLLGISAVTANLNIDFRTPVPLGTTGQIRSWLVRREGRKLFVAGEIHDGDTLLAEATGLFVEVPPEHFERGAATVAQW